MNAAVNVGIDAVHRFQAHALSLSRRLGLDVSLPTLLHLQNVSGTYRTQDVSGKVRQRQVSRSIGDVYLKKPEFNLDPVYTRFQLSEPLNKPVLTAEPSIFTLTMKPQDKFLIFASDGLWEHLTNQQAVEIVYNYPRAGIARRLVRSALQEAAKKREMRYSDLKKIERGIRRHFHDDISVVVIFLDHELLGKNSNTPPLSVKGGIDVIAPSDFCVLDGLNTNHDLVL